MTTVDHLSVEEDRCNDESAFGARDFAENPEPRLPCTLILDVSTSMRGEPIKQLNDGLVCYKDELLADPLAAKRVEVSVITFATEVETLVDFTTCSSFSPPKLVAKGRTHMGMAVDKAMASLEARKQQYKRAGISFYRPWLFLITDGGPNDPKWKSVAKRCVEAENAKLFSMFCVGVEFANFEKLARFSVREPLRLKGLRFRDLFSWLSSSQRSVSRSTVGDVVRFENPATLHGWASTDFSIPTKKDTS